MNCVSFAFDNYTYRYTGLGDRVQQTVNGVITTYVLDLNTSLTQVLNDGTDTYLYGLSRIGEESTTWDYFLGDALGSVRQLTGDSSAVSLAQAYQPYGEILASYGGGVSNYAFTGEAVDISGLLFLRARYQDMGVGRFISRDTWGGIYEEPLSLNRWMYTQGNPINFVDPSGHSIDSECIGPYCIPLIDNSEEVLTKVVDWYVSPRNYYSRAHTPPFIDFYPSLSINYPLILDELGKKVNPGSFAAQFQDFDSNLSGKETGACGFISIVAAILDPRISVNDYYQQVLEAKLDYEIYGNSATATPNYTWPEELQVIAEHYGWNADIYRSINIEDSHMTLRGEMTIGHYPIVGVPVGKNNGIIGAGSSAHWILVLGLSTPKDWYRGEVFQWVKYYNPFNHIVEYLPWKYFRNQWFGNVIDFQIAGYMVSLRK